MKAAKKLILFVMGLTIVSMIFYISCNRYTEPDEPVISNERDNVNETPYDDGTGDYTEGNDTGPLSGSGGGTKVGNYTLPRNSLSQQEQNESYDPEFNSMVLFANGGIPALTTTSSGVLIAAVGDYNGNILVKRSSDSGKNWFTSSLGAKANSRNPFFINCHNGDVLLGITTTVQGYTNTIFYRSRDNGGSWTIQVELRVQDIMITATNVNTNFVTYGQGLTLRHGANQNKLMFPYYYWTNSQVKTNTGVYTVSMRSEDDGRSWKTDTNIKGFGNPLGNFTTYESKLYELSDGSILINMRTANFEKFMPNNHMYWFQSTDYGQSWNLKTKLQEEPANAKHADFVRYEFNGKPIKSEGSKYGLLAHSHYLENSYSVRLTTNDFNNGLPGSKYAYTNELVSVSGVDDGYPAITVLPDGTIGTLTEEAGSSANIIFRRFNLYWLTGGSESVDYNTDLRY